MTIKKGKAGRLPFGAGLLRVRCRSSNTSRSFYKAYEQVECWTKALRIPGAFVGEEFYLETDDS